MDCFATFAMRGRSSATLIGRSYAPLLGIGAHFLQFEVGDVNDEALDSVAFIANLRTGVGVPGTSGVPSPEPTSMLLVTLAATALLQRRAGTRRKHF